jgi:hypothetical protein
MVGPTKSIARPKASRLAPIGERAKPLIPTGCIPRLKWHKRNGEVPRQAKSFYINEYRGQKVSLTSKSTAPQTEWQAENICLSLDFKSVEFGLRPHCVQTVHVRNHLVIERLGLSPNGQDCLPKITVLFTRLDAIF